MAWGTNNESGASILLRLVQIDVSRWILMVSL